MGFYIKKALFPFVYLFFMAITAFGILCIKNLLWLKILLSVLNLGLYAFIVFSVLFKEGEESVKAQRDNDVERREMVRTGVVRPLKLKEEYKPWKGFFIGFLVCVPLLALMLVHTIIYLAGGTSTVCGAIGGLVYFVFFVFFNFGSEVLSMSAYYGSLVAVPAMIALCGVAYCLGAKKVQLQLKRISDRQRQIYGE